MNKIKPTSAELEILNILWDTGPTSVRDVHTQLSEFRDVFYTTTLKTMQVMVSKGLLDRDTSQRAHIYQPLVARQDIEKDLIAGLLHSAFSGSTSRLIISAIGHGKPTADELKEIRSLIDKIDKDAVD